MLSNIAKIQNRPNKIYVNQFIGSPVVTCGQADGQTHITELTGVNLQLSLWNAPRKRVSRMVILLLNCKHDSDIFWSFKNEIHW
jgi:hypothetical protein